MRNSLPNKIRGAILADYVRNGRVLAGDRLPTIVQLAEEYGVSRMTIVHALGLLEQQGSIQIEHGRGCYVTEQSTAASPTPRLVSFISVCAGTELRLHTHDGVVAVCQEAGFHVVLSNCEEDCRAERDQVARAVAAGCEAVILVPVSRTRSQLRSDYLLREFLDVPIILVDIAYPEQGRTQVVFDNYRGGQAITELLIRQGHRRIAFMDFGGYDDPVMHSSTRERYRGYCRAMRRAGLRLRPEDRWMLSRTNPFPNFTRYALPFLQRWRDAAERPSAVIAVEDASAIDTIRMAEGLGIQVPGDLAVAGFDNIMAGRSFSPPFPSTDPDFRRAGELAAELAIAQIDRGPMPPSVYVLPLPVVERRAAVASADGVLDASASASQYGPQPVGYAS